MLKLCYYNIQLQNSSSKYSVNGRVFFPWFSAIPSLCWFEQILCKFPWYTTRKPEKTNGITDGIFPSVIITDGNNSVLKFVGIYRRHISVGAMVGIYRPFCRRGMQFVWKYATAWWRQMILPTKWPRDSNWDSRTVTWHYNRRNHRWNHWRIFSVGDSIGKNHYIPSHLPTLSSSVSPSSFPSHLSPPKLQPTTHPNSPLFSTRALKFLISCTWSQYPFLVDFIIFL